MKDQEVYTTMKANTTYPGQMVHGDTKRLPLFKGQKTTDPREYLFIVMDEFSRKPLIVGDRNRT